MSSANSFAQSLRPNSGLRYAGCVGRVGALAVALGVGFAVASTPGVAHAEESTNPSQSSNPDTGSPDSPDATKAGSLNDSRQSRVSEQRRILRPFGVGANNPVRLVRPGRPAASRRDDGQQASATRDGIDGGSVDGTVSSNTTVDSGNNAGAVVGPADPVIGARGTTIKRSSDDPVRQSLSTRRAPTVRVLQRPVAAATTGRGNIRRPEDREHHGCSAVDHHEIVGRREPDARGQTVDISCELAASDSDTDSGSDARGCGPGAGGVGIPCRRWSGAVAHASHHASTGTCHVCLGGAGFRAPRAGAAGSTNSADLLQPNPGCRRGHRSTLGRRRHKHHPATRQRPRPGPRRRPEGRACHPSRWRGRQPGDQP